MSAQPNKKLEACKFKLQIIYKNQTHHERIWKAINCTQVEWEQLVQNNDNAFTNKHVKKRSTQDLMLVTPEKRSHSKKNFKKLVQIGQFEPWHKPSNTFHLASWEDGHAAW